MNGVLIRQTREALGMRQVDLAQQVGIPQGFLSGIETGKRQTVSVRTLRRLAKVLNLTTDALLSDPQEEAATTAA